MHGGRENPQHNKPITSRTGLSRGECNFMRGIHTAIKSIDPTPAQERRLRERQAIGTELAVLSRRARQAGITELAMVIEAILEVEHSTLSAYC